MSYNLKDKLVIAISSRVIFDLEKENEMYEKEGLEKYSEFQVENEENILEKGTAFPLIQALLNINSKFDEPIVEVIVISRNSPAHKRVILTLRQWGCIVDEAFFLGGVAKNEILKAFNAHIFFDDQDKHVAPASELIPSGRVLYKSDSGMNK